MRLTFIISSLGAAGAERIMSGLANHISQQGHHVSFITLDKSEADHYTLAKEINRIQLNIYTQSRNVFDSLIATLKRLIRIRRSIIATQPDVVLTFIDMSNIRVIAALLGSGLPIVVSERVDPSAYSIGASWEWLRRRLYPFSAKLVVQTHSVENWAKTFMPAQKISVIPNFIRKVDLGNAKPSELPDKQTIIAAGRLVRQKGFDILINAFHQSQLNKRGWQLVILGEGSDRVALENQISQLDLNNCVLLPGQVTSIESWFEYANMFVLSSRFEGFPNVLLEAMACGLPCIAFDCPSGPSDIIRHMDNGLLISPKNIDELSKAMQLLVDNQVLADGLSSESVKIVEEYSIERVANEWLNNFSSVSSS